MRIVVGPELCGSGVWGDGWYEYKFWWVLANFGGHPGFGRGLGRGTGGLDLLGGGLPSRPLTTKTGLQLKSACSVQCVQPACRANISELIDELFLFLFLFLSIYGYKSLLSGSLPLQTTLESLSALTLKKNLRRHQL